MGEILLSLSYLPTAERLTVVVVKAKNLIWTNDKTTAGEGLCPRLLHMDQGELCAMNMYWAQGQSPVVSAKLRSQACWGNMRTPEGNKQPRVWSVEGK